MDTVYQLYGVPGWGSAIVDGALALAGAPYDFVDVTGFDRPGESRERLLAINPLAQVPTLLLPDGRRLPESAAIVLHLAETFPSSGLAPDPGAPTRVEFLHRLAWLVAAVYPTFTFADYPERWAPSAAGELVRAVGAHREALWREWEQVARPAPWLLGERLCALDVYVAVMTRWRPGRDWFATHCPTLHGLARRVDEEARLAPVWARNFPAA